MKNEVRAHTQTVHPKKPGSSYAGNNPASQRRSTAEILELENFKNEHHFFKNWERIPTAACSFRTNRSSQKGLFTRLSSRLPSKTELGAESGEMRQSLTR